MTVFAFTPSTRAVSKSSAAARSAMPNSDFFRKSTSATRSSAVTAIVTGCRIVIRSPANSTTSLSCGQRFSDFGRPE